MRIEKVGEFGYEQAVLGFSLSYNSTLERTKQILPNYAFGIPGEGKFLESIYMWWDITAPRYWWQEADTYRLSTKQSESTMHTLTKKPLTQDNFESPIPESILAELNKSLEMYKTISKDWKTKYFNDVIKNILPEGFLQRRIWCFSYKTLQNIYTQRITHRLKEWRFFCGEVMKQIEHPEFIIKETKSE